MASTLVIKVKYGETLRRFSACILNGELDFNMDGLREKVLHLFNFSPNADLTFTYIDEDSDVVTLADDEDLRDVMRQSLNPLRITVRLDSKKSGTSYARSSGSSTPTRSNRAQHPLNTSVPEILKSVSGPLRGAVLKLLMRASDPTSSPPEIKAQKGLNVEGDASEMWPNAKSEVPNQDNIQLPGDNNSFGRPSVEPTPYRFQVDDMEEEVKKLGERHLSGKPDVLSHANVAKVVTSVSAGEENKEIKKPVGVGAPTTFLDYLKHGDLRKCYFGALNSSGSRLGPYSVNECPFSGMFLENGSAVTPQYGDVPFSNVSFHRGVRCDGCRAYPITGPRFKSIVKENFDLCSICFGKTGDEANYIRIDRPMTYRPPLSVKGLYDHNCRVSHPTLPPHVLRGPVGMKPIRPQLDSCFIQDVNILDGTVMAPSTTFTKIWRMKNNGTIIWPHGTQLIWIGGDRLSETISVELEIPADGLPVEKEIDIGVDFSAPELPGRYISYWRMVLPSGQKFGQRVWVLIQVYKNSSCETVHGFNLNLPPVSGEMMGPETVNLNVEPLVEESLPEPDNSSRRTELVESIVNGHPNKEQELNLPIDDTLIGGGGGVSNPAPSEVSSTISYPIIDFTGVVQTVPSSAQFPATNVQVSDREVNGNTDLEGSLLRELKEVCFEEEAYMNKEILRMITLGRVSESDPLLAELQKMGFFDHEMNKMLLKKHNGSIKRVVMDLVAGEKA